MNSQQTMVRFRHAHVFLHVKWGEPSRKEPWNPTAETSSPRARGEPEGWAWPLRGFQAVMGRWRRPGEWCEASGIGLSPARGDLHFLSFDIYYATKRVRSSLPLLQPSSFGKSLIRIMKLPRPTWPTLTARAQNTACFWTPRLTQVTRTAGLWKALVHWYKIVRRRGHILDFGMRQLLVHV